MRRLTMSIDDDLADTFDRLVAERGYANRSEAFRDLLRGELTRQSIRSGTAAHTVGTLSYVYNHHERQLAGRLAHMQHDQHDVTVAAMHVHLNHDDCLETVVLRGPSAAVIRFAEAVIAEKGVRHGQFHQVPVRVESPRTIRHRHRHTHPIR